jgi:hypothetical protein
MWPQGLGVPDNRPGGEAVELPSVIHPDDGSEDERGERVNPSPQSKKEVKILTTMRLKEERGDNLPLRQEEKGETSLSSQKKEVRGLPAVRLKEEEGRHPPLHQEEKGTILRPNQKAEVRKTLTKSMRLKEERGDNPLFRRRRKMQRSPSPTSERRCLTQMRGTKVITALTLLVRQ